MSRYILTLAFLVQFIPNLNAQAPTIKAFNSFRERGFQENRGQIQSENSHTSTRIRYTFTDGNVVLFFHAKGITYQWKKTAASGRSVSEATGFASADPEENSFSLTEYQQAAMNWLGVSDHTEIIAEEPFDSYTNFYLQHCPNGITNVKTFRKLTYRNLYPNIDVVYYMHDAFIKYDIILHPGAVLSDLRFAYSGHTALGIENGELRLSTEFGFLTEGQPVGWNIFSAIDFDYDLDPKSRSIGFRSKRLSNRVTEKTTIDPALTWGSYFGGTGADYAYGTTTDPAGNVYVTGHTESPGSVAFGIAHQPSRGSATESDAFLVKFNSAGVIQWSTYYGGSASDIGRDVDVDASGNVYLVGQCASTTAIASGGFQNTYGGGLSDAFIAKFSSAGARLWGSYLGGTGDEFGRDIAIDGSGNIFYSGYTSSATNISTAGSHQPTYGGGTFDVFLANITSAGTVTWSTYFGGTGEDQSWALDIDGNGIIYLSGYSGSTSGIASPGSYQPTNNGGTHDAFMARFTSAGVYQDGTYFGGPGADICRGIKVDANGGIYISGYTSSNSGIATAGALQPTYGGGANDAFMAKFTAASTLSWATYVGGTADENGRGVFVDGGNNAYLPGNTGSSTGIAFGGIQDIYGGGVNDAFLVKFAPNGVRRWGTYYGTGGNDYFITGTVGADGQAVVVGQTTSTTGMTLGGHQNTFGGNWDALIVKMDITDSDVLYSRQDGTWSNTNSWSNAGHAGPAAGSLPATGTDVTIGNGNTITLTGNTSYGGGSTGLVIDAGATLDGSSFELTVMGDITVDGTLVDLSVGGSYNLYSSAPFVTVNYLNYGILGFPNAVSNLYTDVVVLMGYNEIDGGVLNTNGNEICEAFMMPPTSAVINVSATTATVSWDPGAGNAFIVVREGTAAATPEYGTSYTANPVYGSGSMLGADNFVVYEGTGTTVTISGLLSGTSYEVDLYSFNTKIGGCYSASTHASFTTCGGIPAPANPVNGDFCTGDAIASVSVDDPGAGFIINWYTDASGTVPATGTPSGARSNIFAPAAAGTFYAKILDSGTGCSGTTTGVTLTELPSINPGLPSPDQIICASGDASLLSGGTATGGNGIFTYQWESATSSGGPFAAIALATGSTYDPPAGMSATSYFRRVVYSASCSRPGNVITVTISTAPAITTQPAPVDKCAGEAATFSVLATGSALSYQWQRNSGNGFNNISDDATFNGTATATLQIANVTSLNGDRFQCVVTDQVSSCEVTSTAAALTVTSPPAVTNQTPLVCEGTPGSGSATVDLTSFNSGITGGVANTTVAWFTNAALTTPVSNPASASATNGKIFFAKVSAGSCSTPATLTTTINFVPAGGNVTPANLVICAGTSTTFTASNVLNGPLSFEWVLPAGVTEQSRNANSITLVVESPPGGTISVTPRNDCGAGAALSTAMTVTPAPDVTIILPEKVFVGTPAVFSFESSVAVQSPSWTFSDSQISSDLAPAMTFQEAGDLDVTLVVTSGNCDFPFTEGFVVSPEPGLEAVSIKNVVTANGDQKNDLLYIERIENFPDNEVILVDRWGSEVYRKKGYANEWDLRKNGQYIPAGNYVCIVKFKGEVISRTVTVLKDN